MEGGGRWWTLVDTGGCRWTLVVVGGWWWLELLSGGRQWLVVGKFERKLDVSGVRWSVFPDFEMRKWG